MQVLGLDVWNGTPAQLFAFKAVTQVTFPLLLKPNQFSFNMDNTQIAVVDQNGIVWKIGSVEGLDEITQAIDLLLSPAAAIELSPKSLYYGRTSQVGVERVIKLNVKNQGNVPLVVSDISATTGDVQVDITSFSVDPRSSKEVLVTLLPSKAGTVSGTVTVHSNDAARPSWQLQIEEIVIEEGPMEMLPAIAIFESALDFGSVEVGRAATVDLTIRNEGQGALTVTDVESDLVGVQPSKTSFSVAAGATETLTLTLSPSTEGVFNGTLNILSNDPTRGTLNVSFSGTGMVIPADPKVDFNGNRVVDFADFLEFAAAFGSADAKFDLSENGQVDFGDFLIFANSFGRTVS